MTTLPGIKCRVGFADAADWGEGDKRRRTLAELRDRFGALVGADQNLDFDCKSSLRGEPNARLGTLSLWISRGGCCSRSWPWRAGVCSHA